MVWVENQSLDYVLEPLGKNEDLARREVVLVADIKKTLTRQFADYHFSGRFAGS